MNTPAPVAALNNRPVAHAQTIVMRSWINLCTLSRPNYSRKGL